MTARRDDTLLQRADARAVQVLLVAVPLLYLGLALGPAVLAWATGAPLRWSSVVGVAAPTLPELARAGVTVTWDGSVDWLLAAPSAGQRAAALLPGVATWLLLAGGCVLAWRLVRTALAGEPFAEAAPGRLRRLALVVIAYGVLVPALHVLASMVVLWSVDDTGALAWVVDLSGPAVAVTVGLLLLVVAECFRVGRRLAQDVDGLV